MYLDFSFYVWYTHREQCRGIVIIPLIFPYLILGLLKAGFKMRCDKTAIFERKIQGTLIVLIVGVLFLFSGHKYLV